MCISQHDEWPKCYQCGEPTAPHKTTGKPRKYCSRECNARAGIDDPYWLVKLRENPPMMEPTTKRRCKQCGDPAEVGNLCDFCAEFTH